MRAEIFCREGTKIAQQAVSKAMAARSLTPGAFENLIFSSCTAPIVPSIDCSIVNSLGFSPNITRVPTYQHGCAGGAFGLNLAGRIASSGGSSLVVAAELCSLGFQAKDLSPGSLVGAVLFADGAGCVVVEPEGPGLHYVDTLSILIPETQHLMGYDIHDDGAHLRLDRELPSALCRTTKEALPKFLAKNGLKVADVGCWLFHPGGAKILDFLESELELDRSRSRWAWDVLSSYGNMSSASVLFVLSEFLNSGSAKPGDYALMLGVGPGITVQLLLFQYRL